MLRTRPVLLVDCYDLDELVTATFGRQYSLLHSGDGEYNNGAIQFVDVPNERDGWEGEMSLAEWLALPQPAPDASYEERRSFAIDVPPIWVLMDELYNRNLVEPGKYAIHIYW